MSSNCTQEQDVQNLEATKEVDLMSGYHCYYEDEEEFRRLCWLSPYLMTSDCSCRKEALMKNLRKFLSNPPPDETTSFKLTGLKQLEGVSLIEEEKTIWKKFLIFWYPKLRSLEVDHFDNFFSPNKSFVNQLLSSPFLQTFACSEISGLSKHQLKDFPQRLFCLENINVDTFSMKIKTLLEFYKLLASNDELKTYETFLIQEPIGCHDDYLTPHFEAITKFMKESRAREVKLNFGDCDWHDWERTNRKFGEMLKEFGFAVAGSKAKLTISGLVPKLMYNHVKEALGNQAHLFSKCVKWAEELSSDELTNCPNLERVDRVTDCAKTYPVFSSSEKLERVRLSHRFPLNLPSLLTHLQITEYASTCFELINALVSLTNGSPQLNKLRLDWKLVDGWFYSDDQFSTLDLPNKKPFPSLKNLEFTFDADTQMLHGKNASGVFKALNQVLLKGFRVSELVLLWFKLSCGENIQNMDLKEFGLSEATMTKMMEGTLSKTLEHLDVFNYTSNSHELVKVLMALKKCTTLKTLTLDLKLYDGGFYTTEPFASPDFQIGESFKSLESLVLKFDADAQLLEGKNASGVFKVLDEVLLTGFKLSELSLNWLGLHGGKNIEKVRGTEGFVLSAATLDKMGCGRSPRRQCAFDIDKWLFERSAAWKR